MPITRKFLDWSRPSLPAAADFLIDRYQSAGVLDLEHVVVVLPGGRAGRRLLEILVESAQRQSLVFLPPQIETMGTLPELLYESKRPFASDLVQKLAWVHALRTFRGKRITDVIPQFPDDDDVIRWLSLGELIWRQHRELAAEGLDFADVARLGADTEGFSEAGRWKTLRKVQEKYLQILDHFQLWDLQTARLFAIEHHECRSEKDILLVGTTDMNRAMRQMLDQVSDRVLALVFAPEHLADRFDEHGCIAPDEWQGVPLNVATEQVRVVDSPADQADAVARSIAAFQGRYRADEITIGVPDDRLVPQIQRQLLQCEIPTRWVVGKPLPQTAPYRLLETIARYIDRGRFDDFAALVRHSDLHEWLERQVAPAVVGGSPDPPTQVAPGGDWLTQLDEYYQDHLPPRLGQWLGDQQQREQIEPIHAAVQRLVEPLMGEPRKLGDWAPRIVSVLLEVYGGVELNRELAAPYFTVAACQAIRSVLIEHQVSPPQLLPALRATQAIQLLLEQLRAAEIPPLPDESAIELLGWLELPLDDAPALIVTSLNEGYVPKSVNSDLFLPNGLRRRLGLVDNARRYARDAYALSVLLAARRDLTLIVGRRDAEGEPMSPSRLLFASDADTVARRALAFFEPEIALTKPPLAGVLAASRETSQFEIARPQSLVEPVRSMSVTAFRSYLACPYRFYLRHVLRLGTLDDTAEELDAPSFGNLAHEVLRRFGSNDMRHSTNADEIRRILNDTLNHCIQDLYGDEHLAAVNVQILQLRTRLEAFAAWQADWARQGWRIVHTESAVGQASCLPAPGAGHEGRVGKPAPNERGLGAGLEAPLGAGLPTRPAQRPVVLKVDNRSITLTGRIDRIDIHEESGSWAIFDYKTSDTAKTPNHVHKQGDTWIDLQLPLYRHLARPLGIDGPVKLGYIVLPKDTTKVGAVFAEWTDDDLAAADEVAVDVARRVLDQQFWPPADPPPIILTEFASICQDGTFDKWIPPVEMEEEA